MVYSKKNSKAKKDNIIFLHIPKTAGTSVWDVFDSYLKKKEIFSVGAHYESSKHAKERLRQFSQREKSAIKVLRGHISYGWHEEFPNRNPRYFTFLRHPIDRVVSHYNFIKSNKNHYLYNEVKNLKMTLIDYVTSGLTEETNNGQVRLLSGLSDLDQSLYGNFVPDYGFSDLSIFEKALANLNKFECVCIQEEFDKGIKSLRDFGLIKGDAFPRTNVTKEIFLSRNKLDKLTEDVIIEYNQLDLLLYEEFSTKKKTDDK